MPFFKKIADYLFATPTRKRITLTSFIVLLLGLYAANTWQASAKLERQLVSIAAEAKAGKWVAAEKAMREQPDLWDKKTEVSASDYLAKLASDQLVLVGLPDGTSLKSLNPRIMFVTRSGDLGHVSDTWRGNLTEQSLEARPAKLHLITMGFNEVNIAELLWNVGRELIFLLAIALMLLPMLPSRSKSNLEKDVAVRFSDVVGANEAKAALQDIVDYLKNPESYSRLGATPPRGVLLYGAPGTGKTLLAKALAGECGVSFIASSGAEFSSKFYGVGIAKVKHMFHKARKEKACIIFIDEIDGIGRRSESSDNSAPRAEENRIINQFLVEMDGFSAHPNSRVIVIGATNMVNNVDPALRRDGRIDRTIELRLPDVSEREQLLRLYSRKLPVSPDVDFPQLARLSTGLSPAAVASLVNQAVLRAARAQSTVVTMKHFADAVETSHLGETSHTPMTEEMRRRTAFHEAGHALVSVLHGSGTVEKVTILPRANALGITFITQDEVLQLDTRTTLNHRLEVLLGGRAAEEVVFGDPSIGASSDLEHATSLATNMLSRFGYGEGLAVMSSDLLKEDKIHTLLNTMLAARYQETLALLQANRQALDALADLLLEHETIDGDQVRNLVPVVVS